MKRTILTFVSLLLAALASLHAAEAPAKRPNIVVIVADDLGYADVLFNPAHPKEVTTAHLDALSGGTLGVRNFSLVPAPGDGASPKPSAGKSR